MSVAVLLEDLAQRGVKLWVEGEKLRYRGSRKVITPDVLAQLKENKPQLLAELATDTSSDTVNERHPLDCECIDCSARPPAYAKPIERPAEVLEMARQHFGLVEDPVIPPSPPGSDPMVAKAGSKVGFFRRGEGWREVPPLDFKVYERREA